MVLTQGRELLLKKHRSERKILTNLTVKVEMSVHQKTPRKGFKKVIHLEKTFPQY